MGITLECARLLDVSPGWDRLMTRLSPRATTLPLPRQLASSATPVVTPLQPLHRTEEDTLRQDPAEIDLSLAPPELLAALDKDARLAPYGGGNFGMPLDLLEPDGPLIVPTERFFLRSNGPVPVLDPATWRLTISGAVA